MDTADILLRLLIYGTLLAMSGFFSGSETALFSVGQVQLLRLREEGHPRAPLLQSLLAQPRRLIATIFIGNEFVNIGASALFASVTDQLLRPLGPVVVTGVSTVTSVLLILFIGEITPKNLAAKIPERWALFAARPIWLLAALMAPLRWTIERIADVVVFAISGRSGGQAQRHPGVGEDEFLTMVDVVREEGELDESESRLIHNIFEFGDRRVVDVMTPREKIFAISYNLSQRQVLELVRAQRFSRIPVYHGGRDRIVGVLYAKDLVSVAHGVGAQQRRLQDLLQPAYFIPKTILCQQLFRDLRRRHAHLALVVDEYGKVVGLVTMEDLLEEMFGEIKDEKELPAPTRTQAGECSSR